MAWRAVINVRLSLMHGACAAQAGAAHGVSGLQGQQKSPRADGRFAACAGGLERIAGPDFLGSATSTGYLRMVGAILS
jgi:hypothetical protein